MNRAVVTGGAGFIGSHVVERLLDLGAEVLVIDDFRLGKRDHLEQVAGADGLTVVQADIRAADSIPEILDFAPDAVFHLAALHFIPYCNAHPQEALDVNVLGLEAVIRSVRGAPLRTFVFPSSGAIYGFGDEPWTETSPARPDEIYGISKWMGEQIIERFHRERPDVRTVVARLFNTYGPRETNPHVLPEVMRALKAGEPIELGNLWPKRDLVFVEDMADALVAVADGEPAFDVFNIGTGTGTAIADVMRVIEEITGRPIVIRQVASRMREGDGHLISDPGKLMQATGWKPQHELEAGLRRLLEWEGIL